MRQVGYLQKLYQDARSTKYKINLTASELAIPLHQHQNPNPAPQSKQDMYVHLHTNIYLTL